MKTSNKKRSLPRRLLLALSQGSLAMIQTYGMGISPAEAYVFLDQKDLFTPAQPYPAHSLTPTFGEQNDTLTS